MRIRFCVLMLALFAAMTATAVPATLPARPATLPAVSAAQLAAYSEALHAQRVERRKRAVDELPAHRDTLARALRGTITGANNLAMDADKKPVYTFVDARARQQFADGIRAEIIAMERDLQPARAWTPDESVVREPLQGAITALPDVYFVAPFTPGIPQAGGAPAPEAGTLVRINRQERVGNAIVSKPVYLVIRGLRIPPDANVPFRSNAAFVVEGTAAAEARTVFGPFKGQVPVLRLVDLKTHAAELSKQLRDAATKDAKDARPAGPK